MSEDTRARPTRLPMCVEDSFEAQKALPQELVIVDSVFVIVAGCRFRVAELPKTACV